MGQIFEFPNRGEAYLRRAVNAYQAYDFETALQGFKKAAMAFADKEFFQDKVLEVFDERELDAEIMQIILALAETGADDERIMDLVEHYDDYDVEEELAIYAEEDVAMVLPDYIIDFIVSGQEKSDKQSVFHKAAAAMQALEMAEDLLADQKQFAPNQQIELLDKITALPTAMRYDILLKLIEGNSDHIFQTDLLHALKQLVNGPTVISVPDIAGKQRQIDLNATPLLLRHDFYLAGLKTIREDYFRDPILNEVLHNEWILICSYVYPFFDIFQEEPAELIADLYQLISGAAQPANGDTTFKQLNKIRSKIFHYQQNI